MSENIYQNEKQNFDTRNYATKNKKWFQKGIDIVSKTTIWVMINIGKMGLILEDKYDDFKDSDEKNLQSNKNKEQARAKNIKLITEQEALEIFAKSLNVEAEQIKLNTIYLLKQSEICQIDDVSYFYKAIANFNGFKYKFKINAQSGKIVNLKINS